MEMSDQPNQLAEILKENDIPINVLNLLHALLKVTKQLWKQLYH